MDLERFPIAVLCLVEELLADAQADPGWRRIRRRGPAPTLADSEVLTMELGGEVLGLDQDIAIYRYVRRAHPGWFPALMQLHRTTFTRQAAHLWARKERVWRVLLDRVAYDPSLSIVASVPVPVCRFGGAWACARFTGEAAYGYDAASKATSYGFRGHWRVCWPGVGTAQPMAAANVHDLALVPELVAGAAGQVPGDRNDWDPKPTAALAPAGIALTAPFTKRAADPDPDGSRVLGRVRWRIETVAAQFVERFHLTRTWARDAWHLTNRVLRKTLSHTVAVFLCLERGLPPLAFDQLVD